MKVLLVNVENAHDLKIKPQPLGLAYLSSFAKTKFPSLEIKIITTVNPQDIFREDPDIAGFSSVSQSFGYAAELINAATRRGIPTLVGGVHISLLPQSLPFGDAIGVVGEGEHTFVDLLGLLREKSNFEHKTLAAIKGIVYWDENKQFIQTPPRPYIEMLDALPLPDRDSFNIRKGQTVYLFSSRGCPFICRFCASTRLHKKIRFFSADYVVNEVKFIIDKHKPILIKFYDDLFIASKPRLKDIVKKLTLLGIPKKVAFSINATASLIDEETAGLLKQMNVYTVGMGFESGNQEILNYLKDGKATVEQNERAVNILIQNKVNPTASFIIGAPGEDRKKFEDTLKFVSRVRLSNAYLYLLTPYPGTPLWDYALKKGLASNDMDWNRLDINQNADFSKRIIVSDCLSADDLKDLFKRFELLRRKNYFRRLIIQGLRRPDLVLTYLRLHLQD